MRGPSRRAVLLTGLGLGVTAAGGGLIQEDVLPGRVRLWQAAGGVLGSADVPDVDPGPVLSGSFASAAMGGAQTGWLVLLPPGTDPQHPTTAAGAPLPVAVALHGRGGDEHSVLALGYDRFLAAAVRDGAAPFAVAAVAGGETYWHRRRTGVDAGRMVTGELLPLLAGRGFAAGDGDRIAFTGWSMGGYGALRLAGLLGAQRVAAVVAASPALWLHPGDSAPGAFDDADDFGRNDVFATRAALRGIAVRVDCGLGDPFLRATRAYVARLRPAPAGGFEPGSHDDAYWRRVAPAGLAALGAALTPKR